MIQLQLNLETETRSFGLNGSVLTIGTFDGVHVGHQQVLAHTVAKARTAQLPAIAVTFNRHPAEILAPSKAPLTITTLDQKLALFEKAGIDATVVVTFDEALSKTPASFFFETLMQGQLSARSIVVGHDFAFGLNREGDAEWLKARIPTAVIPPHMVNQTRVSSSAIRTALLAGNIADANVYLGRTFATHGIVVGGQELGRTIGYPTANLETLAPVILPADGVYAGLCRTPYGRYTCAISLGTRPTVGNLSRALEIYLIDYPGESLYGRCLEVEWLTRVRGQETFENIDTLIAQMDRDLESIRLWFAQF